MISVYNLKPGFQAFLRPLCGKLAAMGVTANQITIGAVLLSAASGAWIAFTPGQTLPLLLLPAVLFVRMALNAIDGMLAREFGQKSDLGAILNEIGDVVSDAVLYLPLALHPDVPAWTIVAVVVTGTIVEMIGVVAVQIGATRRYDGPFGKSDRAAALGLMGFLLGLGITGGDWPTWYLLAALILSLITIWKRGARALTEAGALAETRTEK